MRIAICDDSKHDRESLHENIKLTEVASNFDYSLFPSGEKFLSAVSSGETFEIVFLDVDMPHLDGIEVGKRLRRDNKDVIIIFLTSHPEFALDAYECEAFHYLLKPCSMDKLVDVLNRALSRIGILHRYHVVKTKNGSAKLPLSDIYYIECLDRHIVYHMKDGDVTTRDKLSSVYESLRPFGFCLVHQGFVVNMDKIVGIEKDSVLLSDGRSVMMSVRKKTEVSLAYMKYVEKFAR